MSEKDCKVNGGAHCLIGRFQPFHLGHYELILQYLEKGERVVVLIMDTKLDQDNPFTSVERMVMVEGAFRQCPNNHLLTVRMIPPICDVSIGRKCGFAVRELDSRGHESISATAIRESLRAETEDWKRMVHPSSIAIIANLVFRGVIG